MCDLDRFCKIWSHILDEMQTFLLSIKISHYMFEGSSFYCTYPTFASIDLAYSEGSLAVPSNSFVPNSRWCYPAVQHLTASTGVVARVFHLARN